MKLSGLHLLLTYQCTLACDHCFVWGSPGQSGVMAQADIDYFLDQAMTHGTIKSICFEGGEPFLYYATLLKGVQEIVRRGYSAGIVTNAFWATSLADAIQALQPFSGLLEKLTVSSDLFHWSLPLSRQAQYAAVAAESLGIAAGMISISRPDKEPNSELFPYAQGKVMYRGRAAARLVRHAPHSPWSSFAACPHEDLREPGRVHLDPFGNLHICQGISLGNLYKTALQEICGRYNPDQDPIIGPILRGGPAELVRVYDLPHAEAYADACHLCYESRKLLRARFPAELSPNQMYGGSQRE